MISKYEDEVVAIGALGGSGTRAVAQLLIDAGIYMGGNTLNFANDNLLFTAIFKNLPWYLNATPAEILDRLQIFEIFMRTGKLRKSDRRKVERLPYQTAFEYPPDLFTRIESEAAPDMPRQSWGWKEPNTHIFLPVLSNYFPRLRYIHVLRHGLDMAFSPNKKQLFNWGHLFECKANETDTEDDLARKQLDYWIRSTRRVLEIAPKLLGNRFHLVRYEEICTAPEKEIISLMEFLGIPIPANLNQFCEIFSLSGNQGRYRIKDLDIFSHEQLRSVEELGFEI